MYHRCYVIVSVTIVDISVDFDSCILLSNLCQNSGVCVPDDSNDFASECVCVPPFTGQLCNNDAREIGE